MSACTSVLNRPLLKGTVPFGLLMQPVVGIPKSMEREME